MRAVENGCPSSKKLKLAQRYCKALALLNEKLATHCGTYIKQTERVLKFQLSEIQCKLLGEYFLENKKTDNANKQKVKENKMPIYIAKDSSPLMDENPDIKGLSKKVQIAFSEEKGRHLIATQDIYPGMASLVAQFNLDIGF